jgi:hypothetical protein
LFIDGAVMPLILFGGGWGYYDSHHDFHRAPDAVARHLEQQRASGGFHAGPGGFAPSGAAGRPPPAAGFHPAEGGFAQPRPQAGSAPQAGPPPAGGFHPAAGGFAQPGPQGQPSRAAEPNRGQSGFYPSAQPHSAAAPAAASRPAAAPPRAEPAHEGHGRDCPQGQRC